mgnify:CR=1 FL=1
MPIRITSTIAGFRRAGVAHPAEPTDYPDDHFSAKQLQQLETEPRLVVEQIEDPEAQADPDSDPQGTVEPSGTSESVMSDTGENQLQPLIDIIAKLDPKDGELWNKDSTPKASNFPQGTTAEDRANAWEMFLAQADEA